MHALPLHLDRPSLTSMKILLCYLFIKLIRPKECAFKGSLEDRVTGSTIDKSRERYPHEDVWDYKSKTRLEQMCMKQ